MTPTPIVEEPICLLHPHRPRGDHRPADTADTEHLLPRPDPPGELPGAAAGAAVAVRGAAALAPLPVPLGDADGQAHLRLGARLRDPRSDPGTAHGVDGHRRAQARAPAPLASPRRDRVGHRNRPPTYRRPLVAGSPQRPLGDPVRADAGAYPPVPGHDPAPDLRAGAGQVTVTARVGPDQPRSEGEPCDASAPTPGRPRAAGAGGGCCGWR